jgi:hypothetical protein
MKAHNVKVAKVRHVNRMACRQLAAAAAAAASPFQQHLQEQRQVQMLTFKFTATAFRRQQLQPKVSSTLTSPSATTSNHLVLAAQQQTSIRCVAVLCSEKYDGHPATRGMGVLQLVLARIQLYTGKAFR